MSGGQVYMSVAACRGQRHWFLMNLELQVAVSRLELQVAMSQPTWVLKPNPSPLKEQ